MIALLTSCLWLLVPCQAHADWSLIARLLTPPVPDRTIDLFASTVDPSEEQLETVRLLAEATEAEFERVRVSWKIIRDGYEREQRNQEFSLESLATLFDRIVELRDARRAVRQGFYQDVELVLEPGQSDAWEVFIRRADRAEFYAVELPDTRVLRPYTVDVVRLIESLDPPAEFGEGVEASIEAYEMRLERILNELAALIEEERRNSTLFGRVLGSAASAQGDELTAIRARIAVIGAESSEIEAKVERLGRRLADLHMRTLRMVVSQMEAGRGAELEEAYRAEAFPRLYSETETHAYFDSAASLEGMTGPRRELLLEMRSRFDRALRVPRETIQDETLATVPVDALTGSRYPSSRETPEQKEAIVRIRALQERYNDELARLLDVAEARTVFGDDFVDWRALPLLPED